MDTAERPPRSLISELRSALSDRASLIAVVVLLLIFIGGAVKWADEGNNVDVIAAAFPGWNLVESGSLELSEYAGANPWFVETETGVWSNRSPGIIAVSAVSYLLTMPFTDSFEMWPSAGAAVVMTFISVLIVAAAARREREDLFLPTLLLLGAGSATWGVASGQLWPHGPGQLGVAIAVWYYTRDKFWGAGVGLAIAILIRPPVAVLALILGLGLGWIRKSWRPVIGLGIPSAIAGALVLVYNQILFGSFSPAASYEAAGGSFGGRGGPSWLANFIDGLFSLQIGLLTWSSWILVTLVAVAYRWQGVKPEHKLAVLGAFVFLGVHFWLNRASGGLPYNYRYPIEVLAVLAPALMVTVPSLLEHRLTRPILAFAGAVSLFLQGSYVLFSRCVDVSAEIAQCSLFG